MILILGAVVAGCLLGAAVIYRWWPRSGVLHSRLRRPAVVTLKVGGTFEGVLYEHDGKALVLRNAVAVGEVNAPQSPVDGELIVLWVDVAFVQLP